MTLHINACRLTKKPQKNIRCCHFLLWVEETEVFVIAIPCFEVLDSDCSKKVASKVEKCCVHDIQAKICFFCCGNVDFILLEQKHKKQVWKLELAQK